jgi:hypothetical protein
MAKHHSSVLSNFKEEMVKGLVGHPNDRGKYGNFSFSFSAFNL